MQTIIDGAVIDNIARSNVKLAEALTRLLKENKIYIARAAYNELPAGVYLQLKLV